jgi:multiple sugar transport system ATP-binding protein
MASICFADVCKVFPDGTRAVDGLDLEIGDGEFTVLVGPSGSGKSTALRMVAGLEDASGGSISIGERVVNDVAPRDRDIAMVFQSYALYPHMSVADNMGFALKMQRTGKESIRARVGRASSRLGIGELLARRPRALSGGQRQRVALGRAVVRSPSAFLMDEPLSNLDAKLRVEMRAYIARLHQDLGTTTLYVTHDQTEAMTMGDRVAVMRDGRLEQVDEPQRLYEQPENLFVAGFIGSPAMNLLPADAVDLGLGGSGRLVGFRPEDVELANGRRADCAECDATVEVVQYLGDEQLAYLKLRDEEIVAKLPVEADLQPGMQRRFAIPHTKLHLFDAATGEAVGTVA